jgi:hypothetical protein
MQARRPVACFSQVDSGISDSQIRALYELPVIRSRQSTHPGKLAR